MFQSDRRGSYLSWLAAVCMQVCTLLTSYLLRQYPAESAARAAEVKGEVGTLL